MTSGAETFHVTHGRFDFEFNMYQAKQSADNEHKRTQIVSKNNTNNNPNELDTFSSKANEMFSGSWRIPLTFRASIWFKF